MNYRVTLMVTMDVDADSPDEAFEYVHHEATKNSDFTVVESWEPEAVEPERHEKSLK